MGFGEIAALISTVVDKVWADANIDAQSKAAAIKAQLSQEFESVMGQLEINKAEATSTSLFVAGWRPFVGWTCGLGFGYEFLYRPLLNGILLAFGIPAPFPAVEVEALSTLLFGLLGLGTMRTFEKYKGIARHK